jgi:hypothetical protein
MKELQEAEEAQRKEWMELNEKYDALAGRLMDAELDGDREAAVAIKEAMGLLEYQQNQRSTSWSEANEKRRRRLESARAKEMVFNQSFMSSMDEGDDFDDFASEAAPPQPKLESNASKWDNHVIHTIISDPSLRSKFNDMLTKEHATEGLEFINALKKYDRSPEQAATIYNEFVSRDSPQTVNISGKVVGKIELDLDSGNTDDVFRAAEEEVIGLLANDKVPRFMSSPGVRRRVTALLSPNDLLAVDLPSSSASPSNGSNGFGFSLRNLSKNLFNSDYSKNQVPNIEYDAGNSTTRDRARTVAILRSQLSSSQIQHDIDAQALSEKIDGLQTQLLEAKKNRDEYLSEEIRNSMRLLEEEQREKYMAWQQENEALKREMAEMEAINESERNAIRELNRQKDLINSQHVEALVAAANGANFEAKEKRDTESQVIRDKLLAMQERLEKASKDKDEATSSEIREAMRLMESMQQRKFKDWKEEEAKLKLEEARLKEQLESTTNLQARELETRIAEIELIQAAARKKLERENAELRALLAEAKAGGDDLIADGVVHEMKLVAKKQEELMDSLSDEVDGLRSELRLLASPPATPTMSRTNSTESAEKAKELVRRMRNTTESALAESKNRTSKGYTSPFRLRERFGALFGGRGGEDSEHGRESVILEEDEKSGVPADSLDQLRMRRDSALARYRIEKARLEEEIESEKRKRVLAKRGPETVTARDRRRAGAKAVVQKLFDLEDSHSRVIAEFDRKIREVETPGSMASSWMEGTEDGETGQKGHWGVLEDVNQAEGYEYDPYARSSNKGVVARIDKSGLEAAYRQVYSEMGKSRRDSPARGGHRSASPSPRQGPVINPNVQHPARRQDCVPSDPGAGQDAAEVTQGSLRRNRSALQLAMAPLVTSCEANRGINMGLSPGLVKLLTPKGRHWNASRATILELEEILVEVGKSKRIPDPPGRVKLLRIVDDVVEGEREFKNKHGQIGRRGRSPLRKGGEAKSKSTSPPPKRRVSPAEQRSVYDHTEHYEDVPSSGYDKRAARVGGSGHRIYDHAEHYDYVPSSGYGQQPPATTTRSLSPAQRRMERAAARNGKTASLPSWGNVRSSDYGPRDRERREALTRSLSPQRGRDGYARERGNVTEPRPFVFNDYSGGGATQRFARSSPLRKVVAKPAATGVEVKPFVFNDYSGGGSTTQRFARSAPLPRAREQEKAGPAFRNSQPVYYTPPRVQHAPAISRSRQLAAYETRDSPGNPSKEFVFSMEKSPFEVVHQHTSVLAPSAGNTQQQSKSGGSYMAMYTPPSPDRDGNDDNDVVLTDGIRDEMMEWRERVMRMAANVNVNVEPVGKSPVVKEGGKGKSVNWTKSVDVLGEGGVGSEERKRRYGEGYESNLTKPTAAWSNKFTEAAVRDEVGEEDWKNALHRERSVSKVVRGRLGLN